MHSTSPNTNFPTQGGAALDPCQGLCPWIPPGALYPGGALNFCFGGCVPRGFQNVGSRERIFLKNGGLGNENLEKFWSRELEFWPEHG